MSRLFFVINVLLLIALAGFLLHVFLKARRAKDMQNRLVQSLDRGQALNWFRVKVSRPAYFRRRMKMLGFESSGVLVNAAGQVRVLADFGKDGRVDQAYPKDDLGLRWIGNPGLASANMHWLSLGNGDASLMVSADTGFNAVQSREATADICRMIDPEFQLPDVAKAEFALEKNKASLLTIVLFFGMLALALLDGVIVNDNELLRSGYLAWLLPALALVPVPAYFVLVRHRVPSRESMVLSLLLAMGAAAIFIPLLKRVEQLSSKDGTVAYEYVLQEDGRLEPVLPGPPALDFPRMDEYWAQFEPGSVHRFTLIRGRLGSWQLQRSELNRQFRRFYETQKPAK